MTQRRVLPEGESVFTEIFIRGLENFHPSQQFPEVYLNVRRNANVHVCVHILATVEFMKELYSRQKDTSVYDLCVQSVPSTI